MVYCFDTNVWVAVLRGSLEWEILDARLGNHELIVPSMVKAELLYGARLSAKSEANLAKVESILAPFQVISFDEAAAAKYSEIRAHLRQEGTPIGPEDLVIAATALTVGAAVVTQNRNEFARVPNLKVEDWLV